MALPWFKKFPKDEITNIVIQSLTLFEYGAYNKLLNRIWLQLPESLGIQAVPNILAHCLNLSPSKAVKITQKLVRLDLLQLQDGYITSTKLRVQSNQSATVVNIRKLAGSIGGSSTKRQVENHNSISTPTYTTNLQVESIKNRSDIRLGFPVQILDNSKSLKINVDTKANHKQMLSKCLGDTDTEADPEGSRSYLVDNKQDRSNTCTDARAPTSSSIRINNLQESLFVDDCSPTTSQNGDSRDPLLFDKFWSAYPKKVGKPRAQAAWYRLKPNNGLSELIIAGLERWKLCEQWLSDGGRYVPYPATWLNDHRWEYSPADEHSKHESGEQWLKRVRAERELETSNSQDTEDD